MTNAIQTDIQPKPRTNRGTIYAPKNTDGTYNAEITKTSIRVSGVCTNHIRGPQHFDRVFKIGDEATYDSYNLVYTGPIVKIGPKSVTIYNNCNDKNMRLDLFDFIRRNWNFDLNKINKRNSEWMD